MTQQLNCEQGACLCGQVTYELSGQVSSFYHCHCTRCQKSTGGAHASNLFVKTPELSWLSNQDLVTHYAHPNCRFTKSFCQTCGSPLPTIIADGKLVMVPAGSLLSFDDIEVTAHIFMNYRKAWEDKLATARKFYEGPV